MATQHVSARIECESVPSGASHLARIEGVEALSRVFEFTALIYLDDGTSFDPEAVLSSSIAIVFERDAEEVRRVHGLVSNIRDMGLFDGTRRAYSLTISPRIWRLGLSRMSDVFLGMSVPKIVAEKLTRAGLEEGRDFEFRLQTPYYPREIVVQYRESNLDFVSRLCEHLGVFYFFEHDHDREKIVFCDLNAVCQPLDGEHLRWTDRVADDGVIGLEVVTRLVPGKVELHDYNYRIPLTQISAERELERGAPETEVIEYGGNLKTPDEAARIAKVRAEEIEARRRVYEGKSRLPGLCTGCTATLEDHPIGTPELLLVSLEHRLELPAPIAGAEVSRAAGGMYENRFVAIDKATQYRPQRETSRPAMPGLLSAFVEEANKDDTYANLDAQGRYRVRFVFDRTDHKLAAASHPVRMSQPHGGEDYGMHFPMRHGKEVVIGFVDGDPDRPMIVGAAPNSTNLSPVVAENHFENRLTSRLGNELKMNDTTDAPRVILRSPGQGSVLQLGEMELPESGFFTDTRGHETHVADKSQNHITTNAAELVQRKGIYALQSVVVTAGLALPGVPSDKSILRFEQMSEAVEKAGAVAEQALAALGDRRSAVLNEQLDSAKKARDTAFDAVLDLHQEELAAPSAPKSGGVASTIREQNKAKFTAMGVMNGIARKPNEDDDAYSKRVERERRKPLFGKEAKIKAGRDSAQQSAAAKPTTDRTATTASTGTPSATTPAPNTSADTMAVFRTTPSKRDGESDADHKRRVDDERVKATRDLMWQANNPGKPVPADDDLVPDGTSASHTHSEAQLKTIAGSIAAQSQDGGASSTRGSAKDSVKKDALKKYERAALTVANVARRGSEVATAAASATTSALKATAQGLVDAARTSTSGKGWGDLATLYSIAVDAAQRSRLGTLLQNAARIAANSGSRMMRHGDDVLQHPDDASGTLIHSAKASAALLGSDAVLGAERSATVTARESVNVLAGNQLYLQAAQSAELAGKSSVVVSSANQLDLLADQQVSLIAHPRGVARGADEEQMPHYHSMLLRSQRSVLLDSTDGSVHIQALAPRESEEKAYDLEIGDLTLEAGNQLLASATKAIEITSAEEDVVLTAAKKRVLLHALEDGAQLTAKKAIDISSSDDALNAKSKKKLTVSSDDQVQLSAPKIALNGTTGTTIEDGAQVTIKGTNTVTVEGASITLRGKVYLG